MVGDTKKALALEFHADGEHVMGQTLNDR